MVGWMSGIGTGSGNKQTTNEPCERDDSQVISIAFLPFRSPDSIN